MRFFVITTVAASVAFAIAVPNRGPLCTDSISNNPVCCATDVVGVANLNCAPREISFRLWVTSHRSLTSLYLQPPPTLKMSPTSKRFVPAANSELCVAPL